MPCKGSWERAVGGWRGEAGSEAWEGDRAWLPAGGGGRLQQLPSRPARLPLPSGPLVAGQGGQQGWVG